MRSSDLRSFGAPEALVERWIERVGDLTEVQAKAVSAGALDGKTNLLVVAPTSSGKTFVGEIAAASTAYRTRRHSLFLVPFRALADEHYANFRDTYSDLLSVVISTSDWTEHDDDIRAGNFGLAVVTYEKMTGLLVEHRQLLDSCGCIVVDEVQMLGDRSRGPALELLLTQVLTHASQPQTITLSASLDELNELDKWLRSKLVMSTERPVELREGVLAPGTGRYLAVDRSSMPLVTPSNGADEALRKIVTKAVSEGQQVLVFRSSVEKARETAESLKQVLPSPGLPAATAKLLDELEESENVEMLRRTLASLVAFHSANLSAHERRAVERSFRLGEARVVVATTTLAMGVNLPTDVVVVGDHKRWIPERGSWRFENYTVAEYKNAAGRAGRLGLRRTGLAVLVAEEDSEQRGLLDYYCAGEVEPVSSKLSTERLGDVVFGVLSGRLATTEAEIIDFIKHTFAYLTFYERYGGIEDLVAGVSSAVAACQDAGLVVRRGDRVVPSKLGLSFARRSVPLGASVQLVSLANRLNNEPLPLEETLYCIARVNEVFDGRPYLTWHKLLGLKDPRPPLAAATWASSRQGKLGEALTVDDIDEKQAQALLRMACLLDWMGGTDARVIASRYAGCPTSRVRDMGRTAAWLLEGLASALGLHQGNKAVVQQIRHAELQCRFGLPHELAALARLDVPGVGRATLMRLYEGDKGRKLFEPDVLLDADDAELQGLLRASDVAHIRAAIVQDRGETLLRRRGGQRARAQSLHGGPRLVDDLYTATGLELEQAVAEALEAVGIRATRIKRQKMGEEDLQITHSSGVIVVSVTASDRPDRMVRWNKAKAVLGAGVGLNPINYICVGRPGFHSVAERLAAEIAQEIGPRRLLLVPIDALAEMVLRCTEGLLSVPQLLDVLAFGRGLLSLADIPATQDE